MSVGGGSSSFESRLAGVCVCVFDLVSVLGGFKGGTQGTIFWAPHTPITSDCQNPGAPDHGAARGADRGAGGPCPLDLSFL